MTGFMMAGMAIAVGAAVDMTHATRRAQDLQNAVDATSLVLARQPSGGEGELRAQGEDFLALNFVNPENSIQITDFSVDVSTVANGDRRITVSAEVDVANRFAKIFGQPHTTISAEAAAQRSNASYGADVVIALDSSNSMGSYFTEAKQEVRDVLEALKGPADDEGLNLSFYPVSDRINLGDRFSDWVEFDHGATTGSVVDNDHYDTSVSAGDWTGCVHPRYLDDASDHFPGSPALPYFLSDTPPAVAGGQNFRAMADGDGYHIEGSDLGCSSPALIGPTDDIAEVEGAIDSVNRSGTGRYDMAMAWGWRLLSPRWAGLWGQPDYPTDAEKRRKIMVFVTDGHTTGFNKEFGYDQPWGQNNLSPEHIKNFVGVCDAAKEDGIEIFIIHEIGNDVPEVVQGLKACTSGADNYKSVQTLDDFKAAFGTIKAGAGSTVRLVK